jgi:hypothetical protein
VLSNSFDKLVSYLIGEFKGQAIIGYRQPVGTTISLDNLSAFARFAPADMPTVWAISEQKRDGYGLCLSHVQDVQTDDPERVLSVMEEIAALRLINAADPRPKGRKRNAPPPSMPTLDPQSSTLNLGFLELD